MKKIFSFLLLAFGFIQFTSKAQNVTNCNASFSFVLSNNSSVKFSPALAGDSPVVRHEWVFGDATIASHLISPSHIYAAPGTYLVIHYLTRVNSSGVVVCTESVKLQVVIQPTCNLTAYFTWHKDSSSYLKHYFANQSVNLSSADSVKWTFGDGTSSLDLNPTHTYTKAGTYNTCLRVKKNGNAAGSAPCVGEFCKTIVVNEPCNLVAAFNWSATASNASIIEFKNTSTPLTSTDSVKWTFGDGTTSLDLNAKHTYVQAGTYTVCLRVKKNGNAAGTAPCVGEICKTIVVNQPCNLAAAFNWSATASNTSIIEFKNTSTPLSSTDSVKWTFGDGSSSLDLNAKHTYVQAGTYTVCLRVKKNGTAAGTAPCVGEICKTVVINPPCNLVAYFTWNKITGTQSSVEFQNVSTPLSPTDSVRWTFGDGTSSPDLNTKHTYSQAGTYTVCLRVKKNGNIAGTAPCVREICKSVIIAATNNCDSIHAGFTYQRDQAAPNKIHFFTQVNAILKDQTWTIARISNTAQQGVILHLNNPTYTFYDTGNYRVCLRGVTLNGCVKEYCNTIRIEKIVQFCDLQAYPNPANSQVNVVVHLSQPEIIHAYIYNSMNVLVKDKNQQGVAGNNTFTININDWIPGNYTIKIIYGTQSCYARFTKL